MDTGNIQQLRLPFIDLDEIELPNTSSTMQTVKADPDVKGTKVQQKIIDGEGQGRSIEFTCWVDAAIVTRGLSRHWLVLRIEREETYLDERENRRSRMLVRAKAYSVNHIIQQLRLYADKAELIDPPELRERMQHEVARMYSFYHKC